MPPYYDPHYRCEMELLTFDSRRPNERYANLIEFLKEKLSNVSVVGTTTADAADRLAEERIAAVRGLRPMASLYRPTGRP